MNKLEQEQQLLSLIQLKPVLWQKEHKQHRNSVELSKAWDEIAKAAQQSKIWARNKWKYLKNRMTEELRLAGVYRSGDEADNYESHWHHFESMKFMIDQLTPNKSSGNLSNLINNKNKENIDTNSEDSDMDLEELKKNQIELEKISSEILNSSTKKMTSKRVTKQDKIMELENRKLALLEKAVRKEQNAERNSPKTASEDDDMMYFRTLLPFVSLIDERDKLLYREELIKCTLKFAYKEKIPMQAPAVTIKSKRNNAKFQDSDDDVQIISDDEDVKPRKQVKMKKTFYPTMIKQEAPFSVPAYIFGGDYKIGNIRRNALSEHNYMNYQTSQQRYNFAEGNSSGAMPNINFIPIPVPYVPQENVLQCDQQRNTNLHALASNDQNLPIIHSTNSVSTHLSVMQQPIQLGSNSSSTASEKTLSVINDSTHQPLDLQKKNRITIQDYSNNEYQKINRNNDSSVVAPIRTESDESQQNFDDLSKNK